MFALQIFPNESTPGNALPINLNERTPKAEFNQNRQQNRLKRQVNNQDQAQSIEEETLSPLMVRNFPPLQEEKQNCM